VGNCAVGWLMSSHAPKGNGLAVRRLAAIVAFTFAGSF
jgi:hypothetical protein